MNLKHIIKREKADTKGYIIYDSIYMKFLEKAKALGISGFLEA